MTPAELRQVREHNRRTQPEMAAYFGVTTRTYQRWETGESKRVPSWVARLIFTGTRESQKP